MEITFRKHCRKRKNYLKKHTEGNEGKRENRGQYSEMARDRCYTPYVHVISCVKSEQTDTHQQHGLFMEQLLLQDLQVPLLLLQLTTDVLLSIKHRPARPHQLNVTGNNISLFPHTAAYTKYEEALGNGNTHVVKKKAILEI